MPVRKVKGGYRWGQTGNVYPTRAQAEAHVASDGNDGQSVEQ